MSRAFVITTLAITALGGGTGIRVPVAGNTTTTGTFEGPGWPN